MDCQKCSQKAVIKLQHGAVCQEHFLSYFGDKVFKTIKKYQMITRQDRLCVAASGGKDSLTVLYLIKKYLQKNNYPETEFFALAIDEGIKNYREKTLVDLKKFCQEQKIPLKIISLKKELGFTLDQAEKKIKEKKPCNFCGVWRRYLLNKYARKLGATKLITGHNLDDEAQAILMNYFKANTNLSAHLGPVSGVQEHSLFVSRVKPLYFCLEKETRLYALLKGWQIQFGECPYSSEGLRHHIQEMLNEFEKNYPGTKQGIINSFLTILPLIKAEAAKKLGKINSCKKCEEPANQEICQACKIAEELSNEP